MPTWRNKYLWMHHVCLHRPEVQLTVVRSRLHTNLSAGQCFHHESHDRLLDLDSRQLSISLPPSCIPKIESKSHFLQKSHRKEISYLWKGFFGESFEWQWEVRFSPIRFYYWFGWCGPFGINQCFLHKSKQQANSFHKSCTWPNGKYLRIEAEHRMYGKWSITPIDFFGRLR